MEKAVEKFELSPVQKVHLGDKVGEVVEITGDLDWRLNDAKKTILQLKNLKNELKKLKKESDPEILKYNLEIRRRIADKLNVKFVENFVEGLAIVEDHDGKKYFVDEKGKDICNGQRFDHISNLENGFLSVVKDKRSFFINKAGEELFADKLFDEKKMMVDGIVQVRKKDKWFLVDITGEKINNDTFQEMHEFVDGLAVVKDAKGHFFINTKGKNLCGEKRFQATCEWGYQDYGYHFAEGFLQVFDSKGDYFINIKGEDITNGKRFSNLKDFHNGFAHVSTKEHESYFINIKGEDITNGKHFDSVGEFSEGVVVVDEISENTFKTKRYCIDEDGNDIFGGKRFDRSKEDDILPGDYDLSYKFSEGLLTVMRRTWEEQKEEWFFVNKQGKEVFSGQRFDHVRAFSEGLAKVMKRNKEGEEKWYFINKEGEDIFNGQRFDNLSSFHEGLAQVKKDDKWYFINKKGEDICNGERFDSIAAFNDGVAKVEKDGEEFYIDIHGKRIFSKEKDK